MKWFNDAKGYGFIESDDGDDSSVHFSKFEGEGFKILNEGHIAWSLKKNGEKGSQACKVTLK